MAGGKIILAGGKIISSIMICEEFILPDWSPSDDPARPSRPNAGYGLVIIMRTVPLLLNLFYSTKTSTFGS